MSRNNSLDFTKLKKFIRTPQFILLIGIFLIGIILRAPVAVFGPIVDLLEQDFHVDMATIGLLSGIPVFCFAAFSPIASTIIGKKGLEFNFITSILIITFGVGIRTFGGFELMLASTVIIGFGVALANIGMPLIAARDFPKHFTFVTGLTSATMNLGSVASLSFTAPLSYLLGWRETLNLWTLVCFVVLIVWVYYIYRRHKVLQNASRQKIPEVEVEKSAEFGSVAGDASSKKNNLWQGKYPSIWRRSFLYLVSMVFVCQCFAYFSFTSWLPKILNAGGMDSSVSGAASAILQLLGVVGSISIGVFIKKFGHFFSYLIICVTWLTVPFGLLYMPSLWFIWLTLGGWAQAANYILMFSAITYYAKHYFAAKSFIIAPKNAKCELSEKQSQTIARKLSVVAQTAAYLVAGFSPTIIGALHDASSSWQIPLYILGFTLVLMTVLGSVAYFRLNER